jgi:hypothetical protein
MSALKLKELTVIIASSLCLWSVDIASVNAAKLTFKNETNKIATDFHVKSKLNNGGEINELTIDFTDIRFPFRPIPHGESFTIDILNQFISAEWSFAEGENEPVLPVPPPVNYVPEPLTMLGAVAALGYGALLKRKYSENKKS